MAKEKNSPISVKEGHIVVKNKKFKKSDIIVFCVCIVISFVIWIYATNTERREAEKLESVMDEMQASQIDKNS